MPAFPIRAYKIASGDTLTNLEKAVNQYIAGGWQPYGPPFMSHDHRLLQAMVLPAAVNAASAAPVRQQAQPQQMQPRQAPPPGQNRP